jgi:hypothetical protein
MNYKTRTLKLLVAPEGESIFCDRATEIGIEDEAAGEFVVVTQHPDAGENRIEIDKEEWPLIRAAIDEMIGECRGEA